MGFIYPEVHHIPLSSAPTAIILTTLNKGSGATDQPMKGGTSFSRDWARRLQTTAGRLGCHSLDQCGDSFMWRGV